MDQDAAFGKRRLVRRVLQDALAHSGERQNLGMLAGNLSIHALHQFAVYFGVSREDLDHVLRIQTIHHGSSQGAHGGKALLLREHAIFTEILSFMHDVDLLALAA